MTDIELGRLLLALVVLLAMALACGRIFERCGMPQVVGEIAGGLVLGPSVLGLAVPELSQWLFAGFPAQGALISVFYWIGLILLMFVAGFRVQRDLDAADRRTAAAMLAASLIVPMLVGWFLTELLDADQMMRAGANPVSFHLVLAIGTAVTSIPVISRIFLDLGIMDSRFARIVLMTATVQDLVLWTTLAIATGLNSGSGASGARIATVIATTLAFMALAIAIGPRLLPWLGRTLPIRRETPVLVGYALLVCFALTAAASLLGVNAVFGALAAGIVVGALPHERLADVKNRISDVALWFFVPIYFAIVGLRLDLPGQLDVENAVVFLLASSLLKFGSVALALAALGARPVACVNYGVAMNTRGGPGIVLASVAHAFGIITDAFFVTLVLASIVTSLFTGVWLRFAVRSGRGLE